MYCINVNIYYIIYLKKILNTIINIYFYIFHFNNINYILIYRMSIYLILIIID